MNAYIEKDINRYIVNGVAVDKETYEVMHVLITALETMIDDAITSQKFTHDLYNALHELHSRMPYPDLQARILLALSDTTPNVHIFDDLLQETDLLPLSAWPVTLHQQLKDWLAPSQAILSELETGDEEDITTPSVQATELTFTVTEGGSLFDLLEEYYTSINQLDTIQPLLEKLKPAYDTIPSGEDLAAYKEVLTRASVTQVSGYLKALYATKHYTDLSQCIPVYTVHITKADGSGLLGTAALDTAGTVIAVQFPEDGETYVDAVQRATKQYERAYYLQLAGTDDKTHSDSLRNLITYSLENALPFGRLTIPLGLRNLLNTTKTTSVPMRLDLHSLKVYPEGLPELTYPVEAYVMPQRTPHQRHANPNGNTDIIPFILHALNIPKEQALPIVNRNTSALQVYEILEKQLMK